MLPQQQAQQQQQQQQQQQLNLQHLRLQQQFNEQYNGGNDSQGDGQMGTSSAAAAAAAQRHQMMMAASQHQALQARLRQIRLQQEQAQQAQGQAAGSVAVAQTVNGISRPMSSNSIAAPNSIYHPGQPGHMDMSLPGGINMAAMQQFLAMSTQQGGGNALQGLPVGLNNSAVGFMPPPLPSGPSSATASTMMSKGNSLNNQAGGSGAGPATSSTALVNGGTPQLTASYPPGILHGQARVFAQGQLGTFNGQGGPIRAASVPSPAPAPPPHVGAGEVAGGDGHVTSTMIESPLEIKVTTADPSRRSDVDAGERSSQSTLPAPTAIMRLMQYSDALGEIGTKQISSQTSPSSSLPSSPAPHQRHSSTSSDVEQWKNFIQEFYATNGLLRRALWNASMKESKLFDIPTAVLPRYYQITFESGVQSMSLHLKGAKESELPATLSSSNTLPAFQNVLTQLIGGEGGGGGGGGGWFVDCPQATLWTKFSSGVQLCTMGHMRVTFNPQMKIELMEFLTNHCTEYVSRDLLSGVKEEEYDLEMTKEDQAQHQHQHGDSSGLTGDGKQHGHRHGRGHGRSTDPDQTHGHGNASGNGNGEFRGIPESPINDFGITLRTMRCLEIAESVSQMRDLINSSFDRHLGPIQTLRTYSDNMHPHNPTNSSSSNNSSVPPSTNVTKRRRGTGDHQGNTVPGTPQTLPNSPLPSAKNSPAIRRRVLSGPNNSNNMVGATSTGSTTGNTNNTNNGNGSGSPMSIMMGVGVGVASPNPAGAGAGVHTPKMVTPSPKLGSKGRM